MNRAERRAAARAARRRPWDVPAEHLDCDCRNRWLAPVSETDCPACGAPSTLVDRRGFPMLTASPRGSVTSVYVGCGCGAEYEVTCAVE